MQLTQIIGSGVLIDQNASQLSWVPENFQSDAIISRWNATIRSLLTNLDFVGSVGNLSAIEFQI